MAITFQKAERLIFVTSPQNEVTMQDLVDAIRVYEAELDNLDIPKICDASGKEDLGGGVLVGITVKLWNWKLQFEARPGPATEVVDVTGGNLVAVDGYSTDPSVNFVNPIEPSAFVTVTKTSSASATIAELQITDLKYLVENLRQSHSAIGRAIYWNPGTGDDGFIGDAPARAVLTFNRAQDLATEDADDVVFCVIDSTAGGDTIVDERLVITKRSLRIRGPGKSFVICPKSGSGHVIDIQTDNVEISGIRIDGDGVGVPGANLAGIRVNAHDNVLVENCWFSGDIGAGVFCSDTLGLQIQNIIAEGVRNNGIHISGNSSNIIIDRVISRANGKTGIRIDSTAGTGVSISTALLTFNTEYGLYLSAGVGQVSIAQNNFIAANGIEQVFSQSPSASFQGVEFQVALFQGSVAIDTVNGSADGVAYPLGTKSYPVQTWAQATQIAQLYGFEAFNLRGELTLPPNAVIDRTRWIGSSPFDALLTLDNAAGDRVFLKFMTVSGTWDSDSMQQQYQECSLRDLSNFNGAANDCFISGTVAITADAVQAAFLNGWAAGAGATAPNIDFNGMSGQVIAHNMSGEFKIANITQGDHHWHALAGELKFELNNTGGIFNYETVGSYEVPANLGLTVNPTTEAEVVLNALQLNHDINGTIGEAIVNGGSGGGGGGTACDPDADRIYVDQDYGGKNNLVYVLGSRPVGQATIELFLYDDYMAGNRDASYRVANSRQTDDGTWALPFYLDPDTYILQFYRPQIAGPDAYKLVVSANPDEIVFEQIPIPGTGLSGPATPPIQTTTVVKTVTETTVEGLDEFAGVGTVYVDENYGGAGALTYEKGGVPVNGADILIYTAADYNAGNRSNEYIIAASRQLSDGRWQQPVRLDPGAYKMQFFKQGVAGPDTFDLIVE
tara:strand:- start:1654 stop:4353 length:2700 start_codon:yes stop_codon:yes gene_type:complete